MTRLLLLNPVLVLLVAATGYGVCLGMGWNAHPKEMALAAVGCLAAAGLGLAPLLLQHERTAGSVSQASLMGTVVHMMVGIFFASGVLFAVKPHASFLYWVLVFYWTTLIGLVITFVKAVQSSAPAARR